LRLENGRYSFNTRAGAVVPATNDYTIAQLGGTFAGQLGGSATAATVLGLAKRAGPRRSRTARSLTRSFFAAWGPRCGRHGAALTPPVNPTDDGKGPIAQREILVPAGHRRRPGAHVDRLRVGGADGVSLDRRTPSTQGTLRMTGDTNITSKDGTNERF